MPYSTWTCSRDHQNNYAMVEQSLKQFYVTAKPDVKISAYDLGGQGPPLLIAHANGFHGRCYIQMARFLANHFHCYALDNRGSGDSFIQTPEIGDGVYHGSQSIFEAQDEVPTLQGFAEDIIAVVDHLNYTGIYLFGHSAGGLAALCACQKLKGRVLGLYTYEMVFFLSSAKREGQIVALFRGIDIAEALWRLTLKRRDKFPNTEAALDSFKQKLPFKEFQAHVLEDYVNFGLQRDQDGKGVHLKARRQIEALNYILVSKASLHEHTHLSKVDIPYWSAYGEYSDPSPEKSSFLPHAKFCMCKGLGHFGPFTHPEKIAASVLTSFGRKAAL